MRVVINFLFFQIVFAKHDRLIAINVIVNRMVLRDLDHVQESLLELSLNQIDFSQSS